MSKRRPGLPRRPRSFWPTPPEAVAPLLPHLAPATHYIEPCAGDGSLISALTAAGHVCTFASDLEPQTGDIEQVDALEVLWPTDALVITNPPWDRPIFHAMIPLCRRAWLLFVASWIWTKRARPFARHCALIVPVGRVRWIPGSAHVGMDDCAWFYFDQDHTDGPRVYIDKPVNGV